MPPAKQMAANRNAHLRMLAFMREDIFLANVRDDLSLLASGVTLAREAEAGGVTEVPKA